jgi:hypothetical protein
MPIKLCFITQAYSWVICSHVSFPIKKRKGFTCVQINNFFFLFGAVVFTFFSQQILCLLFIKLYMSIKDMHVFNIGPLKFSSALVVFNIGPLKFSMYKALFNLYSRCLTIRKFRRWDTFKNKDFLHGIFVVGLSLPKIILLSVIGMDVSDVSFVTMMTQ